MLVQEFLIQSAERFPDKTALICGKNRYSYSELLAQSCRVAAALRSFELRRQDRVVIFCENSVEAVVALFGTLIAGGIFVMLNPAMKPRKLAYILNNCGAFAIIAQEDKAATVLEAAAEAPEIRHIVWVGSNGDDTPTMGSGCAAHQWSQLTADSGLPVALPNAAGIDVDLATIIYTSGSTGEPKGVMSAHSNMLAAARSITAYLENTPADIIMNCLPLSFGYGLYQVLMSFLSGGTLILEKSFAYPYRVLQRLADEKATGFPIVPTMAAMMLQMQNLSIFDMTSLRYITNAAAALPTAHIRRLVELFPTARIYSMYGLTECKRVSYMPPEKLAERPGSVGIPMPNCEVAILDEDGRELGPNQVGELVVRGANVMQGYWKSPEETAKRFRPGRYRGDVRLYTGDLFRRDDEGYLYFIGRRDDMIKTKGERVSPIEVENVICELPGVAEVAVVGVPDELLGQAVKAFVVPAKGEALSEKIILNHCRQNLEPFMVPKHIEFRTTLPHTASGKVDKKPLK